MSRDVSAGNDFERSYLPLNVWLQAIFLIASSKKGISSHQLQRMLGVTLKTAWFLSRIREPMRSGGLGPMDGIVEIDETYVGRKQGVRAGKGGVQHKMKVLSLVSRGKGDARSVVVKQSTSKTSCRLLRRISPAKRAS